MARDNLPTTLPLQPGVSETRRETKDLLVSELELRHDSSGDQGCFSTESHLHIFVERKDSSGRRGWQERALLFFVALNGAFVRAGEIVGHQAVERHFVAAGVNAQPIVFQFAQLLFIIAGHSRIPTGLLRVNLAVGRLRQSELPDKRETKQKREETPTKQAMCVHD
jgi:hypothetical protein